MTKETEQNAIVLSSRVRLARNLSHLPFPNQMTAEQAEEVIRRAKDAAGSRLSCLPFNTLPDLEKQALVEEHLASPVLLQKKTPCALLLSDDRTVSVMVNEEDHFRIQSIVPGLDLQEAYRKADETDDLLESKLNFAFDEETGYLTACPTNVGTGMRASVMLHLPAMTANHQINGLIASVGKSGFAVRGMYGEGSQAEGDLYQISNQITLGITEQETLRQLQSVTEQIIERELELRRAMAEQNRSELCDMVWRAYGAVSYAQIMSTKEFMTLASRLRLGVSMGMLPQVTPELLNRLMTEVQPASLQKRCGKALSAAERDFERANLLRNTFQKGKGE